MSFPDPNSFISPPPFAASGGGGDYWSSFTVPTNNQPDSIPQSADPSFKRQKMSENSMIPAQLPPLNQRMNPFTVSGNRGTSSIFYKTRICAKFMEGMCRNGEQCTFAHGPEDLREPPPNWQELIREKERGGNNTSIGDDQRGIHRMKICNKYYNGEECPYGDKCNFVHERAPGHLSNKYKADMSGQRESDAIRLTSDSRRSGVDVSHTVVSWKTKICARWEIGQCPYGEKCNFAHGISELKSSRAADGAIMATNNTSSINIQRRSQSVSSFNATTHANLMTFAPANRDFETDKASRWKSTKRVNRIYGDWLDDGSPPRASSISEEG